MLSLAKNSKSLRFVIDQARGSWIYDTAGRKYLDAFASYSSVNFGHRHPVLFKAFLRQAERLSVFSRTSTSDVLLGMCEKISECYGDSIAGGRLKVIPMNSGCEAGETAVKLARKWGYLHKSIPAGSAKVIFSRNNYWGRTLSAVSTSDYSYQRHFHPVMPGLETVPYDDVSAMEKALEDPHVSAVFLEPVQGEGGVNVPSPDYFKRVREICDRRKVLLIADEIQTGMGRTGDPLCIGSYGVKADMVLLGKSLGGGFVPVSACIARADVADVFLPGEHSSTFGGFPLGCAMGIASLKLLHETPILDRVRVVGPRLRAELESLRKRFPQLIESIRGKGMLFGIQLAASLSPWEVVNRLVEHGIVTREANHSVVRICPPLTISDAELEFLMTRLGACFAEL